jgi:PAS domain S-box-containing protein
MTLSDPSKMNHLHGLPQGLHRRAEDRARAMLAESPTMTDHLSPEGLQHVLHDLQVHQIELEMQNEELRKTQLQLDAARASYFDLYDLAPVSYFTISEKGIILQANLTAANLLSMPRKELVNKPFTQFIFKADQDIYHQFRKQLLDTGLSQQCELRIHQHEDTIIWAHLAATVAQDDSDGPQLRLMLNDISERKIMAAAMRESEMRYRTMVEWSPEAITVNRAGKIIYCNPAAIKLFGAQSGHDLVGKSILELVHPDFHARVQVRLNSATSNRADTEMMEKVLLKLDGTPIHVELQSILSEFDGAPAIQFAMRDVTERSRLSQILQNKNAELESARVMADKANLAKSDFLSSMSHELRSPLNAILGFAQLMDSGTPAPSPSQKASIDQILRGGWYLLELINEILDLATIESGKLSMLLEPTALHEVLLDCQSMMEPLAQQKGIRMTFGEFDGVACVLADRTRLKQVLVNLLSNALKYNRTGGTVDVDCCVTPTGRMRISVQDNGPGLTQEELAQLFQPFNRLGQEGGVEEGTGIGLVVCKRLVELMGGEIGAQSTRGSGSLFWFELDLATMPVPVPGSPKALVQPQDSAETRPQRTVLYVEDNRANMELMEQLIARRPDMRLLTALDARIGIALARIHQPQLILMDINLPGISGLEALKILRADPTTAHIPVLALSANAMPRDIERGLEAGFLRYLTKPIRVPEFMDALDFGLDLAQTIKPKTSIQGDKNHAQ